ncbi:hypothetical protein PENTCL1PPCAC_25235, partial [Pristionchus entomophagus]
KIPGEVVGQALEGQTEVEVDEPCDRVEIGPGETRGREDWLNECDDEHEDCRLEQLRSRFGSRVRVLEIVILDHVRASGQIDVVRVIGERASEDGLEVEDV